MKKFIAAISLVLCVGFVMAQHPAQPDKEQILQFIMVTNKKVTIVTDKKVVNDLFNVLILSAGRKFGDVEPK